MVNVKLNNLSQLLAKYWYYKCQKTINVSQMYKVVLFWGSLSFPKKCHFILYISEKKPRDVIWKPQIQAHLSQAGWAQPGRLRKGCTQKTTRVSRIPAWLGSSVPLRTGPDALYASPSQSRRGARRHRSAPLRSPCGHGTIAQSELLHWKASLLASCAGWPGSGFGGACKDMCGTGRRSANVSTTASTSTSTSKGQGKSSRRGSCGAQLVWDAWPHDSNATALDKTGRNPSTAGGKRSTTDRFRCQTSFLGATAHRPKQVHGSVGWQMLYLQ